MFDALGEPLASQIQQNLIQSVAIALAEDIGDGDITARLIPATEQASANIITREDCVIAGIAWVDEVFAQVDPNVKIQWLVKDGERVKANSSLYTLTGSARSLLTGERAALNFLQLLSGTATISRTYADIVAGTGVKLLDTRKTIPGLRTAQKYAVTCGGCYNHRIGLYDAFLIKENHIAACGGIQQAIATAKQQEPNKPVEIEVEDLAELETALLAGADIVMLDNFSNEEMIQAVMLNADQFNKRAKLEASGGITIETLRPIAETGVDYISIGALTKDCKAVDLSMRFTSQQ